MSGGKCVSPSGESNARSLDLRTWTVCRQFENVDGDVGVDQGFNSKASGSSSARIPVGFAGELERSPNRIKRIVRSETRSPGACSCQMRFLGQMVRERLIGRNKSPGAG